MARSTYKTFLMKKTGETWKKLVDIKDYPNLGGTPDMLDTTTLSDDTQTNEPGIQTTDAMEFSANYTLEDYKVLKAEEGVENEYAVWFGGTKAGNVLTPTGDEGKFKFTGKLSVFVTGAGVNEISGMTISIARSSGITLDEK